MFSRTGYGFAGSKPAGRMMMPWIGVFASRPSATKISGGFHPPAWSSVTSTCSSSKTLRPDSASRSTEFTFDFTRARRHSALATLTGTPASQFVLPAEVKQSYLPSVPAGVPAALLQRRPDIAAAERRVAEANAKIGVAKAAFFPDVSLGLDGGYQSDTLSPWLVAPNEIWSIGPQMLFTLFDGGRRSAAVRASRAQLAENGAKYKATVLVAFQQVEDGLALLHDLGDESRKENQALVAAQRTLTLSMSRYRDGVVSYLDVVTAQTTELDAQIATLNLYTRRLRASVAFIQALGGGWTNVRTSPPDA